MQAVDILNKTTTLNDEDHYEMGLLWRRDDDDDSYQITEGKPAKSVSNNHKVWVSVPIEHWGYGDA